MSIEMLRFLWAELSLDRTLCAGQLGVGQSMAGFISLPVIAGYAKSVCGVHPSLFFDIPLADFFAFSGNYCGPYITRRHRLAFRASLVCNVFSFLVFVHFSFSFSYSEGIQRVPNHALEPRCAFVPSMLRLSGVLRIWLS